MDDKSLGHTLEMLRKDLQKIQKHKGFSNQVLSALKLLESGKHEEPMPLAGYAVFYRLIVDLWGIVDGLSHKIEASCVMLDVFEREVLELREKNQIMESLLEKKQHHV
jgi:hypothetical protein